MNLICSRWIVVRNRDVKYICLVSRQRNGDLKTEAQNFIFDPILQSLWENTLR